MVSLKMFLFKIHEGKRLFGKRCGLFLSKNSYIVSPFVKLLGSIMIRNLVPNQIQFHSLRATMEHLHILAECQ